MDIGAILKALFFIVIGLLLIDLAPIHEGMTCENQANATTCPDVYFSQTFWAARQKFLDSAKAVKGAKLDRHVVFTDPETGIEYPMDSAFVEGAGGAKDSLIIQVSGVHGAEGYIGSAIQNKVLQTEEFWKAEQRPSVLFVHAVNPYGFANNRRFNENNVDLNRNCLTPSQWEMVKQRDPNMVGYDDFKYILAPEGAPTLFDRYKMLFTAAQAIVTNGFNAVKTVFVTGQYHHQNGVYFGGFETQPSLQVLKKVLEPYKKYKQVYVLDIHSGLGKAGHDTLHVRDEVHYNTAAEMFPEVKEIIELPGSGTSSGYELTVGTLDYQQLMDRESDSGISWATEEFGTVPSIFVARAVVLENQAYQFAKGTFIHQVAQQWLRHAFYPQELSTKQLYLTRGLNRFNMTWKHFKGE